MKKVSNLKKTNFVKQVTNQDISNYINRNKKKSNYKLLITLSTCGNSSTSKKIPFKIVMNIIKKNFKNMDLIRLLKNYSLVDTQKVLLRYVDKEQVIYDTKTKDSSTIKTLSTFNNLYKVVTNIHKNIPVILFKII